MRPQRLVHHLMRAKKRYAIVITLILVLAIFISFNHWANQPSSQSAVVDAANVSPRSSGVITFKTYYSQYFSTKLPEGWRVQRSTSSSNPSRIDLATYDGGISEAQITIVSDLLPPNGLEGVADYELRSTETSQYALLKSPNLPVDSTTFTELGNSINDTLFFNNSNRYASISVSGSSNSQVLSLLTKVSQNWIWR